jgi:hypothetical protein
MMDTVDLRLVDLKAVTLLIGVDDGPLFRVAELHNLSGARP